MKKLGYAVLVATTTLFGLTFSYKNPQRIDIAYYFGVDFQLPLPLLLLMTWALGLFLGCLAMALWALRIRRKLSRANRAMARQAAEKSARL